MRENREDRTAGMGEGAGPGNMPSLANGKGMNNHEAHTRY